MGRITGDETSCTSGILGVPHLRVCNLSAQSSAATRTGQVHRLMYFIGIEFATGRAQNQSSEVASQRRAWVGPGMRCYLLDNISRRHTIRGIISGRERARSLSLQTGFVTIMIFASLAAGSHRYEGNSRIFASEKSTATEILPNLLTSFSQVDDPNDHNLPPPSTY